MNRIIPAAFVLGKRRTPIRQDVSLGLTFSSRWSADEKEEVWESRFPKLRSGLRWESRKGKSARLSLPGIASPFAESRRASGSCHAASDERRARSARLRSRVLADPTVAAMHPLRGRPNVLAGQSPSAFSHACSILITKSGISRKPLRANRSSRFPPDLSAPGRIQRDAWDEIAYYVPRAS